MISSIIRGCVSKKVLKSFNIPAGYTTSNLKDILIDDNGFYQALYYVSTANKFLIATSKDDAKNWDYIEFSSESELTIQGLISFNDNLFINYYKSSDDLGYNGLIKLNLSEKTYTYTNLVSVQFDILTYRSQSVKQYNGWWYLINFYKTTPSGSYNKRISRTMDGMNWIHQDLDLNVTVINYTQYVYRGYNYIQTPSSGILNKIKILPDGSLDIINKTNITLTGNGGYQFNINDNLLITSNNSYLAVYDNFESSATVSDIKTIYGADTSYSHSDIIRFSISKNKRYIIILVLVRETSGIFHGSRVLFFRNNEFIPKHLPEIFTTFPDKYIVRILYNEDTKQLNIFDMDNKQTNYDIDLDLY